MTLLKSVLLSSALLFSGAATAIAETQRPLDTIKQGEARRFVVELEGYVPPTNWLPQIKGGKATIEANVYPDHYDLVTRASAAGIIDWFVNYSSTLISKGVITDDGLQLRYYKAADDEGRKNRTTEIVHNGDEVEVEVTPKHGSLGDPAATMEQKVEAMDPISALLQLAVAAESDGKTPCNGTARIFDGKARYNLLKNSQASNSRLPK